MKLHEQPRTERPRERLLHHGAKSLSATELIAILLRTGTREKPVNEYARHVLKRFPLEQMSQTSVRELQTIEGMGVAKAATLKAAFELARRAEQTTGTETKSIRCSQDVYERVKEMRFLKQEECWLLLLDTKHKIISTTTIARGTINSTLIHPREVYTRAIREQAHAIILIHNHPSGDPEPSQEDEEITRQLRATGKTVGIEMLDHVIIGNKKHYSFRETDEW